MKVACENMERVITIAHTPFEVGTDDYIIRCYEALRKKTGDPPTFIAAKGLVNSVKPHDSVIISTGWVVPPYMPRGEIDGPIGAAGLARAIHFGLEANITLVSEESCLPVHDAVCRAAGLSTGSIRTPSTVSVRSFPIDEEEAIKEAKVLLGELNPSAIITIEKCGRNEKGVWHTGFGNDMSSTTAKVDYLVEQAHDNGVLTIGIGDLGNEIGLGVIRDTVKEVVKYGATCRCPCSSGISTIVESDIPVFSGCSNWSAYAIEACLSGLLEKPDLLHHAETERSMVEAAVEAGALDTTLEPTFTCHIWDVKYHISIIEVLRALISARLERLTGKYERSVALRR
ncbi:MAG: glutamate cyclase domain-containing protein [Candidatus Hodarchaeota archaeon]